MKKSKVIKLAVMAMLLVGGLMTAGALVARTVWADDNADNTGSTSSMTVSPMNQQIILTPGETYTGAVKVTNPSSATQALKYTAKVGSFSERPDENSVDDSGAVDTTAVSSYNQMMDWMTVSPESGEVQPNETAVVTFTIRVPEDAPAGGQYATVLLQNDTVENKSGGNINIESQVQIASIIYAEVAGETRNKGQVLENNIPRFLASNDLKATSMVENDGNVHTDATYTLQVWPLFSDEEVCTNEESPTKVLVMPESKKYHVEGEDCKLSPVGIYRVQQKVNIFDEESTAKVTVFVCPIWLIVTILVVIVALVIFAVQKAQARKRKFRV